MSHSVEFFDRQFQRQVKENEFALNPFEHLALPYLHGTVLDLGCGLGNLALEAARRGSSVTAIDASRAAIARIRNTAQEEQLPVEAIQADLSDFQIEQFLTRRILPVPARRTRRMLLRLGHRASTLRGLSSPADTVKSFVTVIGENHKMPKNGAPCGAAIPGCRRLSAGVL